MSCPVLSCAVYRRAPLPALVLTLSACSRPLPELGLTPPRDACRLPRAAGMARYTSAARSAAVSRSAGAGRYGRVPRGARLPVRFSSVMGAAGSVVVFGEGGGVWGTWNRAVFCGAGGVPGFPVRFRIGPPLLSVYSCSRAVVFLTSLSLLCEGVRSGTRRRRGTSALAQAGGGTEPESRRTSPCRG